MTDLTEHEPRRYMLACGCAAADGFVMYPCADHAYFIRERDALREEVAALRAERDSAHSLLTAVSCKATEWLTHARYGRSSKGHNCDYRAGLQSIHDTIVNAARGASATQEDGASAPESEGA